MTILYAKERTDELVGTIKFAMKFIAVIASIPNAFLVAFGAAFFSLWIPGEDARMLQLLAILTVANSCITGPLQPIYQIFTITNKVRRIGPDHDQLRRHVDPDDRRAAQTHGARRLSYRRRQQRPVRLRGLALPYPVRRAVSRALTGGPSIPEVGRSVVSFLTLCIVYFGIRLVMPSDTWLSAHRLRRHGRPDGPYAQTRF